MPHNLDDIMPYGVCSVDWDGVLDMSGRIIDSGTQGWCISIVTLEGVFHEPYERDWFTYAHPAYELAYYGAEVWC